ncbi:MAG: class I SAM-dependent methyltransferase [Jatrophihabitans sp.]
MTGGQEGTWMDEFDAAWAIADGVPGWLRRDQAAALWHAMSAVPAGGVAVEIGSHQGRSTVVLGRAAIRQGARVVAVDPFIDGVLFGGEKTRALFESTVARAGIEDVVELVPRRSTELRPSWTSRLAMLYIDGKHDYWTVRDDLRWVSNLEPGAPVLIHDSFSSIGVTLALLAHVLPGRGLRYVRRAGSMAVFEASAPSLRDRLRIVAELPWFIRNVVVKVGLRVLRPFGFRRPDPY